MNKCGHVQAASTEAAGPDPAQGEGGQGHIWKAWILYRGGLGSEPCTEGRPGLELCIGQLGLGSCIIGTHMWTE